MRKMPNLTIKAKLIDKSMTNIFSQRMSLAPVMINSLKSVTNASTNKKVTNEFKGIFAGKK